MFPIDAQELADRYIAQWTEPDAAARRTAIERLWAADGRHVLRPPAEIRESAAALGFGHTTLEAGGHDAIEARVTASYERFTARQGVTFRSRQDAVRLDSLVTFGWQAVAEETGEVLSEGREVVLLDDSGRIATDYMFPGA